MNSEISNRQDFAAVQNSTGIIINMMYEGSLNKTETCVKKNYKYNIKQHIKDDHKLRKKNTCKSSYFFVACYRNQSI